MKYPARLATIIYVPDRALREEQFGDWFRDTGADLPTTRVTHMQDPRYREKIVIIERAEEEQT